MEDKQIGYGNHKIDGTTIVKADDEWFNGLTRGDWEKVKGSVGRPASDYRWFTLRRKIAVGEGYRLVGVNEEMSKLKNVSLTFNGGVIWDPMPPSSEGTPASRWQAQDAGNGEDIHKGGVAYRVKIEASLTAKPSDLQPFLVLLVGTSSILLRTVVSLLAEGDVITAAATSHEMGDSRHVLVYKDEQGRFTSRVEVLKPGVSWFYDMETNVVDATTSSFLLLSATLDKYVSKPDPVVRVRNTLGVDYIAMFFPEYVKFGCAKIYNYTLEKAYKAFEGTRSTDGKHAVSIQIGQGVFTPEILHAIVNHPKFAKK